MAFLNKSPLHHVYMNKGMVIMLLQSLSSKQGLNKVTNILLHCKIASGDYAREEVLNKRIEINRNDEQYIEWNRRQYPVKPTFAMTINKTQCQTHKKVAVRLDELSFTHGRLYVTTSRVRDPQHLHLAADKSVSRKTRNAVYKQIL